jgi:hypothetical protein
MRVRLMKQSHQARWHDLSAKQGTGSSFSFSLSFFLPLPLFTLQQVHW